MTAPEQTAEETKGPATDQAWRMAIGHAAGCLACWTPGVECVYRGATAQRLRGGHTDGPSGGDRRKYRCAATGERAALFAFRAAGRGLLLAAVPALLVLVVWLCLVSPPAP
ncbi:hypothetical protein [Streptomyces malaysiensis]|uniref:hypothetical protein n=1 Tax=Streptomyces malaysiensis TaxID=92644 RepID=UPI0037103365